MLPAVREGFMKGLILHLFGLVVLVLSCAESAWAQTQGKWLCTNCNLTGYAQRLGIQPQGALPAHDQVVMFIASVVNTRVAQWRAGESVAVCDRSTCVMALYTGSPFVVWQFFGTFPDSGPPYRNGDGDSIAQTYGGDWWEGFGQLGYGYYSFNLWLYASPDPPYEGVVIPGPITVMSVLSGVYAGLPAGGGCGIDGCPIVERISSE